MTKKSKTGPPEGLKVLFVDDEDTLQEVMKIELPRMGHTVTICPNGETAIAALEKNSYDCLLVDIDMPGISGIDVIGKAAEMSPETVAIVLTGKSSLETAIAALRFGAFDYLTKPCRLVELDSLLQKVAENLKLRRKYLAIKHQLRKIEGQTRLVGDSEAMADVRKMIARVAPTSSSVLIHGETGTGKELVARAFHEQSHRSEMPFVAINCGALPESLIESELFGHRRGSFTGADENRVGLFEVANGGTIFLDEIGELPKTMQAKLLRVLECGEIRRVGDNESFVVVVRVVCATNRDLAQMVLDGDFREDLMFRINTFEIEVPPLRSRISDIPLLATHLLSRFLPNVNQRDGMFSEQAVAFLTAHVWPGNVRELANVVEHAAILCDQLPIEPEHFPQRFAQRQLRIPLRPISLREIELQAIYASIERHAGNKQAAAAELGISLKTLYNRLNQAAQLKVSA